MGITVRGFYLEHTVTKFHDGNIECTATEVEHCDLHVLVLLVQTICEGCCSRLIDNTLYIESGDLTSLLGSLTL